MQNLVAATLQGLVLKFMVAIAMYAVLPRLLVQVHRSMGSLGVFPNVACIGDEIRHLHYNVFGQVYVRLCNRIPTRSRSIGLEYPLVV